MILLAGALVFLVACDTASEIASEAVGNEIRSQYIAQCESVAANTGIAAERVAAACECSADDFAADLAEDGQLAIDQARIEAVLKACVQENQGVQE